MTFREASSDEQKPPDTIETPTILNPATSALLRPLEAIRMLLAEIRSNAERDEVPAPGMFRLPLVTSVRVRSTHVIILPTTAATYALRVGTENRINFATAANGILDIPLAGTFDRGIRVSIVTSAGVDVTPAEIADAFLFGYPE